MRGEEDDDDMVLVPIVEERREGGAKAIWMRRGGPGCVAWHLGENVWRCFPLA